MQENGSTSAIGDALPSAIVDAISGANASRGKPKSTCVEQLAFELEEPELSPGRRWASKILHSHWFTNSMATIILGNLVVMVIETDRSVTEDEGSGAFHWTEACSWMILLLFVLELVLRLYVYRCSFWLDKWSVFDFLIVAVDVVFSCIGIVAEDLFPTSVLRIFRLGKLARVSKVFRAFPELRLLVAGLVSSMSAIFWGTVLLVLSLLVWSMIAVLFIHPLNETVDYGESCERCPRAYSSVLQASLTFWQQIVTGDSWGQATIPLIEKYPMTACFFVPLYLCVGLAVMNLILGVVVSIAQQAKEEMEEEDRRAELVMREEQNTHLLGMCMEMDKDGDGVISQDELRKVWEEAGEFHDALAKLDVTKEELDIIWKIIDSDQKGTVPYEEVVSSIYKMKGSDTHYMLAYIKHYITLVSESIQAQMAQNFNETMKIEQKEREGIQQIQQVEALEFGRWQTIESKFSPLLGNPSDFNQVGADRPPQFCSESNEQIANLFNQSRNVSPRKRNTDTSIGVRRVSADDETGIWLKHVSQRIAVMQVELHDIWRDMDCKVQPLMSPVPACNQGITAVTNNSHSPCKSCVRMSL